MKAVSWCKQMEVGYLPLDEEHKAFLSVVNESVYVAEDNDFSKMNDVFEKCYEYARTHFPHEEDVMARILFPDLKVHMRSHQLFIQNISELRQAFCHSEKNEEKEKIAIRTSDFLNVWFLGHILSRDKVYKPYLVRLRYLQPRMNYHK